MRRPIDTETAPGLLVVGVVLGMLLLPALWLARLGVNALRDRGTAPAPTPAQLVATTPPRAPTIAATPTPTPRAAAVRPPELVLPVRGARRSSIPNTFGEQRGNRRHEGVDIRAPRGTPVVAAADGPIARVSRSGGGGIEIYQLDESGRFCFYYAHLLRYAQGLREGQKLARRQVIAYVGTSGNAPEHLPHLHFAVYRNDVPDRCDGEPVNPLPLLR